MPLGTFLFDTGWPGSSLADSTTHGDGPRLLKKGLYTETNEFQGKQILELTGAFYPTNQGGNVYLHSRSFNISQCTDFFSGLGNTWGRFFCEHTGTVLCVDGNVSPVLQLARVRFNAEGEQEEMQQWHLSHHAAGDQQAADI